MELSLGSWNHTLQKARLGDRVQERNRKAVLSQWDAAGPIVSGSGGQPSVGPLPSASAPANSGIGSPFPCATSPKPKEGPHSKLDPITEEVPPQRRGQLGDLIPDAPRRPDQGPPTGWGLEIGQRVTVTLGRRHFPQRPTRGGVSPMPTCVVMIVSPSCR